jgi:hypothetical protein
MEPASLYMPKSSRSVKNGLFIESYKLQRPRRRVNCQTPVRAPQAGDAWRKFTEIYGIPRARGARALSINCFKTKYIVQHTGRLRINLGSKLRIPMTQKK